MIKQWSNVDNNNFYEKLASNGLEDIANQGGIATGCDVLYVKDFWENAKNILDVGSGYGRVIDCLLDNNYSGKIVSLERCETLFDSLAKKYLNHSQVRTLKVDLHDLPSSLSEKFQVILWMWAGIADFAANEQAGIVAKLANLLEKNGTLIIDTMPYKVTPLLAEKVESQYFTTTLNGETVHTYEPSDLEIRKYGETAGFKNITHMSCTTDIQRQRSLHILRFF